MQKKRSGGSKVTLVVLSVLIVLMLGLCVAGIVLKHGNLIYPNVTLCGVEVGGMTTSEAEKLVTEAMADSYGVTDMELQLPDRTLIFEAEKANVSLDMDYAMEKALAYGREGNMFSCLYNWFECRKTSFNVDISSAFTMNASYLKETAEAVKAEVDRPMKDSSISYNDQTQMLTVTTGIRGVSVDAQKLVSVAMDAYSRGAFTGTEFNYDVTLYNPVNLSDFYRQYCTPVKNATYDAEKGTLTEEVVGFGFDLEAAQQQVNMAKEGETLVFPLSEMLPSVTKDQLYLQMFPDVLGEYHSPHTINWARTTNLDLACKAINGQVLDDGEVFSFNDSVGERTAAKGYQPATVFGEGGTSEAGLGGGVCQVASTMYMASLLADFEIVQRQEHMFAVDYVPLGMDATIYWDTGLDYKFRNNTGNPMYIEAYVKDNYVHIIFRGIENKDYTVKMTYDVLKTIPWEDEYTYDNSKPAGYKEVTVTPYTGYNIVTYMSKIDADGNVISTEKEAYSNYIKRNRHTVVGPEVLPEADPEPAPDAPVTPTEPVNDLVTPDVPNTDMELDP